MEVIGNAHCIHSNLFLFFCIPEARAERFYGLAAVALIYASRSEDLKPFAQKNTDVEFVISRQLQKYRNVMIGVGIK